MKKRLSYYLLPALCLAFITGSYGDQPTINGPPVDIEPRMDCNRYRGARATGIIDVPPIVLWNVLTDYENDSSYFPNTRESRILEKDGNRILVHKKMKFYFFSFNVDIEYREERKGLRLSWNQVKGPFTINNGDWILEPHGGKRTRATYNIELDHPLMTRWLAERLLRKNIPEMYRIINERAKYILNNTEYLGKTI